MLTTDERRLEFVQLVRKMRNAQKAFFKSRPKHLNAWLRSPAGRRSQKILEDANYFERQVDRALKRLGPQKELFDA